MINIALILGGLFTSSYSQETSLNYERTEIIQNHIQSLKQQQDILSPFSATSLCSSNVCCNITSADSCPLMKLPKDQSTLVLPG